MENQGQQPSQPVQGSSGQQGNGFYGWQYDQDNTEIAGPRPPAAPLPPRQFTPPSQGGLPPSQGGIPAYPEPQPSPQAYIPHSLQQPPGAYPPPGPYQEPYADMGSTLSYGQGMEYQYFDAPQPSQPIAQLRQERLQQLREERMRRQQRRMKADVTTIIPWRRNPPRPTPPPIPGSRPRSLMRRFLRGITIRPFRLDLSRLPIPRSRFLDVRRPGGRVGYWEFHRS
ncbi:hypothetical protein [Ktedonobacter sp. SOSP1-52]|uniref:hypothetical protein n=1 Tax=Ktedonobacter sp. SOSP1-52 TaxID=2778366 RepID=UPI001915B3F0|nr:hypothetical protein [Ktedonobacter sp. SOSP1-52]